MKCMKCGKPAYKSVTSEAIELGFGLLVVRNIPCYKCEECDEIATRFSRFPHVLGDAPAIAVHIAIVIWHHSIMVAWLSW